MKRLINILLLLCAISAGLSAQTDRKEVRAGNRKFGIVVLYYSRSRRRERKQRKPCKHFSFAVIIL